MGGFFSFIAFFFFSTLLFQWRDEVLSEFFEEHSLVRIKQDREALVALLQGFEALPMLAADPACVTYTPSAGTPIGFPFSQSIIGVLCSTITFAIR